MPIKWIYLCWSEWNTAMASYNNSHIFVNSCCVSFSWLWFPPLKCVICTNHGILNIFLQGLNCWFFNHLTYFCVEGWQSLFLVVVYVEYFLILQWFFDIVIELYLANAAHLCFYTIEFLLILVEQHEEGAVVLFVVDGSRFIYWSILVERCFLFFWGKVDLVEIVKAFVHSIKKALFFIAVRGSIVIFRHRC